MSDYLYTQEMLQKGLQSVSKELTIFNDLPDGKKIFPLDDGDEVEDEYGNIMTDFVVSTTTTTGGCAPIMRASICR